MAVRGKEVFQSKCDECQHCDFLTKVFGLGARRISRRVFTSQLVSTWRWEYQLPVFLEVLAKRNNRLSCGIHYSTVSRTFRDEEA